MQVYIQKKYLLTKGIMKAGSIPECFLGQCSEPQGRSLALMRMDRMTLWDFIYTLVEFEL